jgi:hypothetical protein
MRWLFLFVLLVNIIFVGWEMSQSKVGSTVPEASTEIPTIELLSETGQATKIPAKIPTKVPAKAVTKASKATQVVKSAERSKQPVVEPPMVDVQPSSVDRCYTLGPFRELDNLRIFTRAIKDYVIAASFRSREEQEQSMFWVYLEPEATLKEARALGNRLKNKKIKDYYVISSGPKENGLSLGHFKEKDRAYSHAESIKELGFKPVIEPVFKSYTIYWLDYHVPAGKVIPQKIFSKHLAQKINRLDRSCS